MSLSVPALTSDRCRCAACGLSFKSTAAFDAHRAGPFPDGRRCLTADELQRRGYAPDSHGFWRQPLIISALRRKLARCESVHAVA